MATHDEATLVIAGSCHDPPAARGYGRTARRWTLHDEAAFLLLGLKPTLSEQAVHDAFQYVERVYRPERFVGDPPEVRAAVVQLRQHAVNAYAYLCARQRELRTVVPTPGVKRDPWEVARRYREQAAQGHSEALEQEARHARWAILEQEAKERARREAELAAMFQGGQASEPDELPQHPAPQTNRSLLQIRLGEARAALSEAKDVRDSDGPAAS